MAPLSFNTGIMTIPVKTGIHCIAGLLLFCSTSMHVQWQIIMLDYGELKNADFNQFKYFLQA